MNSREDYNQIFTNGINHLSAADELASKELYGFAISHTILGIEELIKYQIVQYISKESSNFNTEILKIYRDHLTKHSLLKEFIASTTKEFYEGGVEVLYTVIIQDELSDALESIYKNRFRQLGMFLHVAYKDLNISNEELKALLDWLDQANNLKNDGFYVDYRNGKVKNPNDLTIDHYQQAKRFGEIVRLYTSVIKSLDFTEEEFIDMLNEKI